ncbi:MAG: type IV conjugative transfer system protein TraL [Ottowia sp.]|jgi:conjugal transfer pilus assembly protein TraL|nr:type IV conjugative transfer system protein TraL [Ottowia sp.]
MSQEDHLRHYIPRRLDDKAKFLFWELDVAAIAFAGIFLGVYGGLAWGGVLLGVLFAAGWSRLKSGKHPGMATHVMYWFTGYPKLNALPPSYIRELVG